MPSPILLCYILTVILTMVTKILTRSVQTWSNFKIYYYGIFNIIWLRVVKNCNKISTQTVKMWVRIIFHISLYDMDEMQISYKVYCAYVKLNIWEMRPSTMYTQCSLHWSRLYKIYIVSTCVLVALGQLKWRQYSRSANFVFNEVIIIERPTDMYVRVPLLRLCRPFVT